MHLLGISGSLRKGSFNTKLVHEAARLFEPSEFTFADLNLPLYNGDVEDSDGIPASVQTLADQIMAADAVVIASPEYNQSFSGVLKNALDWISRSKGGPWKGKPVALVHAAAGRAGGARANYALRLAMAPFNTKMIQGPEVLVAGVSKEFEGETLTNERYLQSLEELMTQLKALAASS